MSDLSFSLDAWFAALFASTKGDAILFDSNSDENLTSRDLDQIERFLGDYAECEVDLATDPGYEGDPDGVAGFVIKFSSTESFEAAIEANGQPNLEVHTPEHIYGAYLIAPHPRRAEIVRAIIETYPEAASTTLPLPGGSRKTPQPEAQDAGPAYTVEQIEAAFLAPDDAENTDATSAEDAENVESREADDAPPVASDAEPEGERDPSGSTYRDAIVINPERLPEAFLERDIKLNVGVRRDANKWPLAQGWKVINLVDALTEHKVGKKDGPAILQGYCPTDERKKAAMTEMYIAGIDVDCGVPMKPVLDRIAKLGLFCLAYTTHSNLTTESEINEKKFIDFAREHDLPDDPPETIGLSKYLKKAAYVPEIADTAEYVDKIVGTPNILIKHAPIEKYRLIFPLAEVFKFDEQRREIKGQQRRMTQPEAHQRWRNKLIGLAKLIGVPLDKSCTDPSRLFYLPRHAPGASNWACYVIGGDPLKFDEVPEADDRVRGAEEDDLFAAAASAMIGRSAAGEFTLMRSGTDLREWASAFANQFQITMVFDDHVPELVRNRISDDKWEVKCPFDEEHTNTGDETDRGTFICNGGSDAANGGGFMFRCQHNHCFNRDRLHMLKKAIDDGWFDESILTDTDYNDVLLAEGEERPAAAPKAAAPEADDDEDAEDIQQEVDSDALKEKERIRQAEIAKIRKKVQEEFTPSTEMSEIEQVIKDLAYYDANDLTMKNIINQIVTAVKGVSKTDLAKFAKEALKKAAQKRAQNDTKTYKQKLSEFIQNNKIKKPKGKDIILFDALDYEDAKQIVIETFNKYNRQTPIMFRFADERVRCVEVPGGKFEMAKNNRSIMRDSLHTFSVLYKNDQETGISTMRLPDDYADDLVASPAIVLPELEGFASQPYYTASGVLVKKAGYDHESQMILRLPPTFELPPVPEKPTLEQVDDALNLLLGHVFYDFPFDDGSAGVPGGHGSRAHFLAMLLQQIVRPMIAGNTPLYLVTKPMPGTGATYLVSGAIQIATGDKAQAQTEVGNDDEFRKNITSQFASGKSYFWVDNIIRKLDSPALANLATLNRWEDRMLGGNSIAAFPNKMQVILSANNPTLSSELLRRCAPIRLDAKLNPKKRDPKKFRVQNFEDFVNDNQMELFAACLTLVNHWIAIGKPEWKAEPGEKPLASFPSWCRVMGGILQALEMPGFLSNMHLTESVNEEDLAWYVICTHWLAKHPLGTKITADQLTTMYCDMDNRPTLPRVKDSDQADIVGNGFVRAVKHMKDAPSEAGMDGSRIDVLIRVGVENTVERFWLEKVDTK